MCPRSSTGRSSQVEYQLSSAPANDGTDPSPCGSTSLIRWSSHGPSTPRSASAGLPSSRRTKPGESRSTRQTSTSSRRRLRPRKVTVIVRQAPGGPGRRLGDRGAVEVLEGAGRRRAPLTLVARAVLLRAVGVLRRRGQPEEAELPDLHARVELDRQRRDVGELERHVAGEAGVHEARGRVREQPEPPERALALHARGDVVGQRDDLVRRAEGELPRVQDERLVAVRLDDPGEVGLVGRGSMCGYLWFSKTRKKRSSRTSIELGCSIEGSHGSITIRPLSISARMSRSESSTADNLPSSPVRTSQQASPAAKDPDQARSDVRSVARFGPSPTRPAATFQG